MNDYENGKVDIMLNNNNFSIKKDSYYTKAAIKDSIVVASSYRKSVDVNNLNDLKNYDVVTLKHSKIASI